MDIEKLVKSTYDKFVNKNFISNVLSVEKKASTVQDDYYVNIRSNNFVIEIVVYKKNQYGEFEQDSFLCYIRQTDSFAKFGNYKLLTKYLTSLYMNEKFENIN